MTAPTHLPRVLAKGGPRMCKTCRAPRELLVRAERTERKKDGLRFAGYCSTCGHHVGAIATSKVDEADQIRLELALDEFQPEQKDMFAGARAPRAWGDGA